MKFLADECCDAGLVNSLREAGHDVASILERKAGISDEEIMAEAYNEGRILITEDKDFGELVYRLIKPSRGIILIRIDVQERHMKPLRLNQLLEKYQDQLSGHFVVVDAKKFRFRSLLYSE